MSNPIPKATCTGNLRRAQGLGALILIAGAGLGLAWLMALEVPRTSTVSRIDTPDGSTAVELVSRPDSRTATVQFVGLRTAQARYHAPSSTVIFADGREQIVPSNAGTILVGSAGEVSVLSAMIPPPLLERIFGRSRQAGAGEPLLPWLREQLQESGAPAELIEFWSEEG